MPCFVMFENLCYSNNVFKPFIAKIDIKSSNPILFVITDSDIIMMQWPSGNYTRGVQNVRILTQSGTRDVQILSLFSTQSPATDMLSFPCFSKALIPLTIR